MRYSDFFGGLATALIACSAFVAATCATQGKPFDFLMLASLLASFCAIYIVLTIMKIP